MNVAIDLKVSHVLDVSPRLEKLWQDTLDRLPQESLIVHTLADFDSKLDTISAALAARSGAEAEIADLKAKLADAGLTGAEEEKILARLDAIIAGIPAPMPTPTPTPEPTPTPTPEPTPAPPA